MPDMEHITCSDDFKLDLDLDLDAKYSKTGEYDGCLLKLHFENLQHRDNPRMQENGSLDMLACFTVDIYTDVTVQATNTKEATIVRSLSKHGPHFICKMSNTHPYWSNIEQLLSLIHNPSFQLTNKK